VSCGLRLVCCCAADRRPSYGDLEASWEPVGMV
jgi:hypothetical protein